MGWHLANKASTLVGLSDFEYFSNLTSKYSRSENHLQARGLNRPLSGLSCEGLTVRPSADVHCANVGRVRRCLIQTIPILLSETDVIIKEAAVRRQRPCVEIQIRA